MHPLEKRVGRLMGARPLDWQTRAAPWQPAGSVEGANERYSVLFDDGRHVFVKAARGAHTAAWLRREHEVYANLRGSFMPRLEAFDDDPDYPILVLEDLSDADWEVRWDEARVAAVRAAMAEVATSAPPPNTLPIRTASPDLFGGWTDVERDPEPFLSTGIRSRAWLDRNLPALRDAAESAPVEGAALLHLDVRSDNLCFRDGRAILVDWNWCCLANADLDVAGWLPSLSLEGGPEPWEVLSGAGGYAAVLAGFWAPAVGLPPPATAPTVRAGQRRQLEVALAWCERELGL
jgi:thiamine kinase-like enzyme